MFTLKSPYLMAGTAAVLFLLGTAAVTMVDMPTQTKRQTIVDCRTYGCKGDGSTDDTAAIQAAIDAVQNSTYGGSVLLPGTTAGIYAISGGLTWGNGTSSSNSSKKAVKLIGAGTNGVEGGAGFNSSVLIRWTGSAPGGTTYMLSILGPLESWGIQDLTFDANAKANLRGILIQQAGMGSIQDVSVVKHIGGPGIVSTTVFANGYGWGSCRNQYRNLNVSGGAASSGMLLTGTVSSYDSCSNTFIGGQFNHDGATANTYGVKLAYADNNVFVRTNFLGAGGASGACGITFDNSFVSNFPNENSFIGTTSSSGACGTGGPNNILLATSTGDCSANCDFYNWGGTGVNKSANLLDSGELFNAETLGFNAARGRTLAILLSTYGYLPDYSIRVCTDCIPASIPCSSGGSGALTYHLAGAWNCF